MELAQIAILSFAWRAFAKVLCSFPHQCLHSYPLGRLMTGNHARHCTPATVKSGMIAVATQYFTFWLPSWHTYSFTALLSKFQQSESLSWWPHPSPRKMESSKRMIWSFALKTKKNQYSCFQLRQKKRSSSWRRVYNQRWVWRLHTDLRMFMKVPRFHGFRAI